jgi:hypothetical protein
MAARRAAALGALLLTAPQLAAGEVRFRDEERALPVARAEIAAAMRTERGYNATATTNAGRFYAGFLGELARRALARDPQGPPLLLGFRDTFAAFLEVTGLPPERAPVFIAAAHRHEQDHLIEYRPECVLGGHHPGVELAVSVKARWPRTLRLPSSYSYVDALSRPQLRVTDQRVVTYRLLWLPDAVVYDEVQGVSGRPTTGPLALLFQLIGDGQVAWSRSAVAADGVQVVHAQARKGPFRVTSDVTIHPDGAAEKGVPTDRPDLQALARRLARAPAVTYRRVDCS